MVCRVAPVASGQRWWVAVRVGPVRGVPAVGAVVVLVCVRDVLGRVVMVVVVVGGWALHGAVLGTVVSMRRGGGQALSGPRVCGRLGLGRELPSLTPE